MYKPIILKDFTTVAILLFLLNAAMENEDIICYYITKLLNISTGNWQNWNFPNTIGADGKHIQIQALAKSGSLIIKRFLVYGSDCTGVLSKSLFGKALYNCTLNILHETNKLPGSNIELLYFVVVMTSVNLHNFLMTENANHYVNKYIDNERRTIPGIWRNETSNIENLRSISTYRATRDTYKQRGILTKYLSLPAGEVI
ncbi:hypothetical protein P5V15_011735 [Pogonomyrmex californicus]